MKSRLIWLLFGVAFSVTLAVVVGQRLSSEGMAVIIGVIAGVAASIPTSLMVVWFMGRNTTPPVMEAQPVARQPEPAEPRIVVMPAPQSQPQAAGYANLAGYGAQSYAGFAQAAVGPTYATSPAFPARRFTVIGGAVGDGSDGMVDEPTYLEEGASWQR